MHGTPAGARFTDGRRRTIAWKVGVRSVSWRSVTVVNRPACVESAPAPPDAVVSLPIIASRSGAEAAAAAVEGATLASTTCVRALAAFGYHTGTSCEGRSVQLALQVADGLVDERGAEPARHLVLHDPLGRRRRPPRRRPRAPRPAACASARAIFSSASRVRRSSVPAGCRLSAFERLGLAPRLLDDLLGLRLGLAVLALVVGQQVLGLLAQAAGVVQLLADGLGAVVQRLGRSVPGTLQVEQDARRR